MDVAISSSQFMILAGDGSSSPIAPSTPSVPALAPRPGITLLTQPTPTPVVPREIPPSSWPSPTPVRPTPGASEGTGEQ